MPGDPLRDYKRGELLDAATVNAHSRLLKRFPSFDSPGTSLNTQSNTIVLMRNDGASGEDVDRFGVLGIDGVVIDRDNNELEFDNRILLSGVMPKEPSSSEEGHSGKFAIALEPIAVGQIGRVVVSGAVQCQIQVNDEDDQFADVLDGDNTQLQSGASGARILYKSSASGSGTRWAIINIGAGASGGTRTDPKILTGTGATANTDTWDIDVDKRPVNVVYPTREYFEVSSKTLWGFAREHKYDSAGQLYYVGAEVRTAIIVFTCSDVLTGFTLDCVDGAPTITPSSASVIACPTE